MDTKKNVITHEIEKEKFTSRLYNNKFFLISISVIAIVVLMITVALLIGAFTVWK